MAARASILSVERISDELRRMLVSDHPRQGLEVLRDGSLLAVCLPELEAMVGVEQGGFHIYDVFDHSLATVAGVGADIVGRAAALCHDIGKPPTHVVAADGRHTFYDHASVGAAMATEMLARLRFSNEEIASVAALVRHHLRPIQYRPDEWSDAAVRRLVRDIGPLRDHLLELARADTRASSFPDTIALDDLEARMDRLDAGEGVSRMHPPLDGNELMRLAGGRSSGPWIKAVHRALEEAVLEGELPPGDRVAALEWLGRHPDLLTAP